jgi:hypothetical protein
MLSYAAKAHNMRIVCAWLAHATAISPNVRTRRGRLLAASAFALAKFSFELDCSERFPDPGHLQIMVSFGYDFIHTYIAMHNEAASRGLRRYSTIPKLHAFMHCLDDMQLLEHSARYHTCYREEDFVGRVGKIAAACSARNVGLRVLERWWLGIAVRLRHTVVLE